MLLFARSFQEGQVNGRPQHGSHRLYLMSTLPQYKVAAIRGNVLGAGISLVAAMDYVVAPGLQNFSLGNCWFEQDSRRLLRMFGMSCLGWWFWGRLPLGRHPVCVCSSRWWFQCDFLIFKAALGMMMQLTWACSWRHAHHRVLPGPFGTRKPDNRSKNHE